MSYQVLARKWRPQTFDKLVGQQHVLKALSHALDQSRVHHAYLFTGTRGVGKTTIARLLAKALNCEQGVTATPCGQCGNCLAIAEGRFMDLIEVDAASRTRVEDTRELLENVQYAPSQGRYKVYLIDEVHMLSSSSFNALLKTLEEPPAHVKFLLATTDPQKLPVTILSRCLQFNLKPMTAEQVAQYLAEVLTAEKIAFEEDALELLGRSAQGSMRDALSLTDQAIAFGQGQVMTVDVVSMLGTLDRGQIYHLLQLLLQDQRQELMRYFEQLADLNPDYGQVLDELLRLIYQLSLWQLAPAAATGPQQQRLAALAAHTSSEDLQLYYQCGLMSRKDLALAPDPRMGFEMALLRMLAFTPRLQSPELLQALGSGASGSLTATEEPDPEPEPASQLKAKPEIEVVADVVAAPVPDTKSQAVLQSEQPPAVQVDATEQLLAPEIQLDAEPEPLLTSTPEPIAEPERQPAPMAPTAEPEALPVMALADLLHNPEALNLYWCQHFEQLGLKSFMRSTLHGGQLLYNVELARLEILLPEAQKNIWGDNYHQRMNALMQEWLQTDLNTQVRFVAVAEIGFTPAAYAEQQRLLRQAQARAILEQEPQVVALLALGSQWDEQSIELLNQE